MSEVPEKIALDAAEVTALYARAGVLGAYLASRWDASAAAEAKRIANKLLSHVAASVEDFAEFRALVDRSEEFSLNDAARIATKERNLKVLYLRATTLLDGIRESENLDKRWGSRERRPEDPQPVVGGGSI